MNTKYNDLIELSEFYILSQQYDVAIKALKKARRHYKMDSRLYYNLGIAYEALNEADKARDAFRLALKLNPEFKSAQEHLDRLIEK